MLNTSEQWLFIADSFADAALDRGSWYQALAELATATGSADGQLISIGMGITSPFNIWTIDPEVAAEFNALDFSNPELNPRVLAGMTAGPGRVIADADFITQDEAKNNEHYKWSKHRDVPYCCLTSLITGPDSLIGLAVSRSQKDGHISPEQKRVFASLAPHVRTAVRTRMLLEGNTATLLTGTMEAMSLAAFACDHTGKVMSMSRHAEALLDRGRFLKLHLNYLRTEVLEDNKALEHAIQAAVVGLQRPGTPLMQSLFIRSPLSDGIPDTIIVDVVPLPSKPFAFGFAPRALVVVRGSAQDEQQLTAALKITFQLTDAEAQIAVQLSQGKTPEGIAEARTASLATVRTQIKNLYEKMGIKRQGELVARLNPLQ